MPADAYTTLSEAAHSHMLSADYSSQPCLRLNMTCHRHAGSSALTDLPSGPANAFVS